MSLTIYQKIGCLIGKTLCGLRIHRYRGKPIVADLDTYWVQGGEVCTRCRKQRISFKEAEILILFAYNRGKSRAETHFLTYGRGVTRLVELYGKVRIHELVGLCKDIENKGGLK